MEEMDVIIINDDDDDDDECFSCSILIICCFSLVLLLVTLMKYMGLKKYKTDNSKTINNNYYDLIYFGHVAQLWKSALLAMLGLLICPALDHFVNYFNIML